MRVAIVGGGLAGLAAATRLGEVASLEVTLCESRRSLGGRAGSYYDSAAHDRIDYCQHVGMGCCTNLQDFLQRTGIAQFFHRHEKIPFFGPQGEGPYWLCRTPGLPAPLHLASSLARLGFLTRAERWRIVTALLRLGRHPPREPDEPCDAWLRRHGQSSQAVERFWSVILVSALGETLDRVSIRAARKVFVDGFLRNASAYSLDVPTEPLGRILDQQVADSLRQRGTEIRAPLRVRQIQSMPDGFRLATDPTRAPSGEPFSRVFDAVIVATSWRQANNLFEPPQRAQLPQLARAADFASSPITGLHLWFDRAITGMPYAVIVDRLTQWIFNRGTVPQDPNHPDESEEGGQYLQVVISASRNLRGRSQEDIVEEVVSDIGRIWPAAGRNALVHYRLVTQAQAVFTYSPDLDQQRPECRTSLPGLFLAGDWTDTGWPSTMEGAVRSGYIAAEAVCRYAGYPQTFLCPDLPTSLLARILGLNR